MSLTPDIFYHTSSFINWLKEKRACDIKVLSDRGFVRITNGMMKVHIGVDPQDRIDYDEIWRYCDQLQIVGLPSPKELKEWIPPPPRPPQKPRWGREQ